MEKTKLMFPRSEVGLTYQLLRIRLFEERALKEFSRGNLFGTTHTCIGQEADCVGVIGALKRSDIVVSNHRGHGHYLAHGGDMRMLAAELMGRSTGVCGGIGGSQHLHFEDFYSNGVLGGTVPCAAGMALAEKRKGSGRIVTAFIGDGTLGEGVVYESLNIASLWCLPMLFVVENNRYAQTTPIETHLAGEIALRLRSFHIDAIEVDTTDVVEIGDTTKTLVADIRGTGRPRALVIHTYRLAPHSKGDDFRDVDQVESFRQRDPISVLRMRLAEAEWQQALEAATREVDEAYRQAESDPWPGSSPGRNYSRRGCG